MKQKKKEEMKEVEKTEIALSVIHKDGVYQLIQFKYNPEDFSLVSAEKLLSNKSKWEVQDQFKVLSANLDFA